MITIYVVTGETGEYDSVREWIVKSFIFKKSAEKFLKQCEQETERIYNDLEQSKILFYREALEKEAIRPHEYDDKFELDHETYYEITETNLFVKFKLF